MFLCAIGASNGQPWHLLMTGKDFAQAASEHCSGLVLAYSLRKCVLRLFICHVFLMRGHCKLMQDRRSLVKKEGHIAVSDSRASVKQSSTPAAEGSLDGWLLCSKLSSDQETDSGASSERSINSGDGQASPPRRSEACIGIEEVVGHVFSARALAQNPMPPTPTGGAPHQACCCLMQTMWLCCQAGLAVDTEQPTEWLTLVHLCCHAQRMQAV